MNRDDIIRMAREAGLAHWNDIVKGDTFTFALPKKLERFAELVAAAVAPVCGECGKSSAEGWALYCVQCSEDSMVKAAVAEEREACARIVEGEACAYSEPVWAVEIVNDIRARGEA